jgi:rhamnogalacturonan acetylesterase
MRMRFKVQRKFLVRVCASLALCGVGAMSSAQTTQPAPVSQTPQADTPELNKALSKAERSFKTPANPALPTLWIIGDSTVRNGEGDGANGQWGWGDEIDPYFFSDKINVVNRALGGRSSRTYYTQNWPATLALIHSGDFVLMQFGHNDGGPLDDPARARGSLPGTGDETKEIDNPITHLHETVHTFGWYEKQMIEEGRKRGATVIVCSPIPRKIWSPGANGQNEIKRDKYADWSADVAQQEHAAFVDLNRIVGAQYEQMGPDKVDPLFGDPHTHTTLAGAQLNARAVIEGLKGLPSDPLASDLTPAAQQLSSLP